ncbi:hypothetical protein ACOSQ2_013533 [Xanthoceras sorbifolium]
MVGTTLEQQLRNFTRSMYDQGILDLHFENIMELQNHEYPCFVTQMIGKYVDLADASMAAVTRQLSDLEVNFDSLIINVEQLGGGSASIGGNRMALVCHDLRLACDDKYKESFFERVKPEYRTLRDCLNHIWENLTLKFVINRIKGENLNRLSGLLSVIMSFGDYD